MKLDIKTFKESTQSDFIDRFKTDFCVYYVLLMLTIERE